MASDADARPLSEAAERRLKLAMDVGERSFSALLFASFALRIGMALTHTPWDILGIVNEGLVVVFIVFRRGSMDVSTRPMDWLFALAGTGAPMLARPGGPPLVTPTVCAVLMLTGIFFAIWGKLILARSFGLAAANRGVVHTGAYHFVRHPIYAGYVVFYVGFWLLNPTLWNAGVYVAATALLVIRILAEERVLARDPVYAEYMSKVRFRLAPGLF